MRVALSLGCSLGSVRGRAGAVAASPSWRWRNFCLRRGWRRGVVVDRAAPPLSAREGFAARWAWTKKGIAAPQSGTHHLLVQA